MIETGHPQNHQRSAIKRTENIIYRGRVAPSPTGFLHVGHARTFWIAMERSLERSGLLIYRNEDLDLARCKPEYVRGAMEDLRRFGLEWQEGPDVGGDAGPYSQSLRLDHYRALWKQLQEGGHIYPCDRSRRDVQEALGAPHDSDQEPLYPVAFRPAPGTGRERTNPDGINWRFRVPDGETIRFLDGHFGDVAWTAGADFGDFLIWRRDGYPSYEMAVVADDHAMGITEVVRGEDLLLSTARQLLLYRALGWTAPSFFHVPLVLDEQGRRMAKRSGGMTIRYLMDSGLSPREIRARYFVSGGGSGRIDAESGTGVRIGTKGMESAEEKSFRIPLIEEQSL